MTSVTGDPYLGVLAAAIAGGLMNMILGYLVISRGANQLASGLALMFLGFGLSAWIGRDHVGAKTVGLPRLTLPGLADLPELYASLLRFDVLIWLVVPVAVLTWWLVAAASGADSYKSFHELFTTWLGGWPGLVVGVGLTFAWLLHFFAGIRHFVLDAGAGFELKANRNGALFTLIGAIIGTGIVWALIFWKGM